MPLDVLGEDGLHGPLEGERNRRLGADAPQRPQRLALLLHLLDLNGGHHRLEKPEQRVSGRSECHTCSSEITELEL